MALKWYKVAEAGELPAGQVMTALAGVTAVCLIHTADHGFTALDITVTEAVRHVCPRKEKAWPSVDLRNIACP